MENKIVYSAVGVLFIFSVVLSIVLYQQQKNTREAVEKINTLQVKLPDALQQKCEQIFVARTNETFAGISKENQTQITQATKEISAAAKSFSGTSSATLAEIKKANQTQVEQATKEISALARQKIIGNEAAAREAYDKAQEYVQKGDYVMAELWRLGGDTRSPSEEERLYSQGGGQRKSGASGCCKHRYRISLHGTQ